MGKVIDITSKLTFEENPKLVIRDVELEVNNDAMSVLKMFNTLGDGNMTPGRIAQLADLMFTDAAKEKIAEMHLSFDDYAVAVNAAIDLIVGNDEEGNE